MAWRRVVSEAVSTACAYRLWKRIAVCKAGLFVATAALLALIAIGYDLRRGALRVEVGEAAPKTIRAPSTVRFVDREATERLRSHAADAVAPRYDPLPNANGGAEAVVDLSFDALLKARASAPRNPAASPKTTGPLSEMPWEVIAWGRRQNPATLEALREETKRLATAVMSRDIRDDESDLVRARQRVREKAALLGLEEPASRLVAGVGASAIRPTLSFNRAVTEADRREAMEAVRPVERTIMVGEVVVAKDQPVTAADLAALRALGLTAVHPDARRMAAVALLAGLGILLVAVVMRRYAPEVYAEEKRVLLFALVAVAALASVYLINIGETRIEYLSMLTVGAGAIMLTALLGAPVAMPAAVVLSVLAAVVSPSPASMALLTLGASLAGLAVAAHIWPASELLGAGTAMAAVNTALMVASGWVDPEAGPRGASDILQALIFGYGAPVLAVGAIAALQRPFDIATHLRLLELANPNEPLLKRLLAEAPGTYSDSALVANLAGAAAEAIGADPLLARVGAFYHDIGKLRRPYFFYENQALLGTGNVHEQISPSLSSVIITSHAKDGVELAREHRVPSVVRDIIAQHHGTSLVQFFYYQASAAPGGEDVSEERFRYPGPKPRTKEAAIVMLADSAFAAVWALAEKTPERVEATVRQVIRSRVADGQLNASPLTLDDVTRITDSFLHMLKGILFHMRIEYPEVRAGEDEDGRPSEERSTGEGGPKVTQAGRDRGPAP
jgi:hypothetical protein